MDERAQAGLVLIFRVLLTKLRRDENFNVYRFSDRSVELEVSHGFGSEKWRIVRTMTAEELSLYYHEDDEAAAGELVADLFDRLRRPSGVS